MRFWRRLPVLFSLGFFWISGSAATIAFDDLAMPHAGLLLYPIPEGYSGLSWSNFGVADSESVIPGCPSGYCVGTVSSPNVAFNANGDSASFASRTPFTLTSFYATAAWNNGLSVRVEGLRGGSVVRSTNLTVDSTFPSKVMLGWSGLQQVRIASWGGTDAGYFGGGTQLAIDNIEIGRSKTYGLFIGVKAVTPPLRSVVA